MKIDYKKFIEENFSIPNKDTGTPVPFKLTWTDKNGDVHGVQDRYYQMLIDQYGDDMEGVREIVLKARQEGMSSFILALFTVDFLLKPYSASVCISHRKDSTEILFKKVKFYIKCYLEKLAEKLKVPYEVLEKKWLTSDNKSLLENAENHATFYIGTAGSKVGGRGGTVNNILFSECLTADQKVIGKDGFIVPITDVSQNTKILNGRDNFVLPVGLQEKTSENNIISIESWGNKHFPIKTTTDHKILISRAEPRRNESEKSGSYYRPPKPEWVSARDVKEGDFIAFPSKPITPRVTSLSAKKWTGQYKYPLNREIGSLIGWYLAEGSIGDAAVVFSVHDNEVEIIKNLLAVVGDTISSVSVYKRDGNGSEVYAFGKCFRNFVLNNFGSNETKRIPDSVWFYPKEFSLGLLDGLFKGDGAEYDDRIEYASTRPQLAVQVRRLLMSHRIGYSSISIEQPRLGGTNSKGIQIEGKLDCWKVIISGLTKRRFLQKVWLRKIEGAKPHKHNRRWKSGAGYTWVKVKNVEQLPPEDVVYDIVLDSDPHSFCLLGGVVHNCAFYQDTELITAQEIVLGTSQMVTQGSGKIFIESTANGEGNYYHAEWERANLPADREGKRQSSYYPRFFGWQESYTAEWIAEKAREFPNEKMFKQEYPSDPGEAFITSGTPYFDVEILQSMLKLSSDPIYHGKIAPDGQLEGLPLDQSVTKVYRDLQIGEQIVIFADPADSHDFCAAVAVSKKHYDFPIVFNEVMDSSQFGYELYYLAKYIFSKTSMWPKLAVERNTGQATIYVLKTLNYPDLFRMVDFSSQGSTYEKGGIGWVTTGHISGGELQGTRRKMLDDFALVLRQGAVKIYDKAQIKQMKEFQIVKGRAQAKAHKHDDLVMATAGAWQVQQLTPSVDFGYWDEDEFRKEKEKWRFK